MPKVTPLQRARTDQQKQRRRTDILSAADTHFKEAGFENFSMATLARQAGIAKGTLYLYFQTREEVLLDLYIDKLLLWEERLVQALQSDMSDTEFAQSFLEISHADTGFVPLATRLSSVIEQNISIEKLIESKRSMAAMVQRLSGPVANALRLEAGMALDAVASLGALLIGTAHADQSPAISDEDLPEDVRAFIGAFSHQQRFIDNACRILSGIRAGN